MGWSINKIQHFYRTFADVRQWGDVFLSVQLDKHAFKTVLKCAEQYIIILKCVLRKPENSKGYDQSKSCSYSEACTSTAHFFFDLVLFARILKEMDPKVLFLDFPTAFECWEEPPKAFFCSTSRMGELHSSVVWDGSTFSNFNISKRRPFFWSRTFFMIRKFGQFSIIFKLRIIQTQIFAWKVSVSTRKECTRGTSRENPKASPSNVVTKTTKIPIDIDIPVFHKMFRTGLANILNTGYEINTRYAYPNNRFLY